MAKVYLTVVDRLQRSGNLWWCSYIDEDRDAALARQFVTARDGNARRRAKQPATDREITEKTYIMTRHGRESWLGRVIEYETREEPSNGDNA
ncbi:MAG: hypothetical protein AAF747_09955 [Planctomycetota bacterium]